MVSLSDPIARSLSSSSSIAGAVVPIAGNASALGITCQCPKCRKRVPVADAIRRGSALWCTKDSTNYNALQARWSKNPQLRSWWNSLSEEEQCSWFNKWQGVSAKRRFDDMSYFESTARSQEMIDDEFDSFVTWSTFKRDGIAEGRTVAMLERDWQDIIDSNRAECLFRRGEFLVPRFDGVQRRKRFRTSQLQEAKRGATVGTDSQLNQLWESGKQVLDRFATTCVAPLMPSPPQAPLVQSSAIDQPSHPSTPDLMFQCIEREVIEELGRGTPPHQTTPPQHSPV